MPTIAVFLVSLASRASGLKAEWLALESFCGLNCLCTLSVGSRSELLVAPSFVLSTLFRTASVSSLNFQLANSSNQRLTFQSVP